MAWWEGSVTLGVLLPPLLQAGRAASCRRSRCTPRRYRPPAYARTGEVDTLDGFLLAHRPVGGARTSASTTSLGRLHGYDLDFCLQVREAGKKVDDGGLPRHPPPLAGPGRATARSWIEAHMKIAEKWDGRMPGIGTGAGHAGRSARQRAEAEADAARARTTTEALARGATRAIDELKARARRTRRRASPGGSRLRSAPSAACASGRARRGHSRSRAAR